MAFDPNPTISVVTLPRKSREEPARHAIRIAMVIARDSAPSSENIQIGPITIGGDQFIFNSLQVGPTEIGPIKAIQYSVTFFNDTGNDNDGSFFIYIPSSGQVIEIASGNFASTSLSTNASANGCVAVETGTNPTITFAKSVDQATQVSGIINLVLFDFEVQPWTLPTQQSFGL